MISFEPNKSMLGRLRIGIGIGRLTTNFRAAAIDGCFTVRCVLLPANL